MCGTLEGLQMFFLRVGGGRGRMGSFDTRSYVMLWLVQCANIRACDCTCGCQSIGQLVPCPPEVGSGEGAPTGPGREKRVSSMSATEVKLFGKWLLGCLEIGVPE